MAAAVKRPAPVPRWFWFASLLGCTPGFKKSRCKKLLKVTMSRIKLLRGRREVQVRQLRRDVAQLLQLGQDENAESRLDRLWKEHSLLSAYIKIGEFCQFVKANLRNIAGQRECPVDLKESLASLCFAASCCADLPELHEIRDIMILKYGSTFLTSAHELLPGEHVNRLFLDAFSTKHPLEVSKKALLKSVVAEYNVVQPKKLKVQGPGGALQKIASSDCKTSQKQESRPECGSNTESCKQDPKLNALEQEEKHKNTPKQIHHSTSMPASGAYTEEHASLPHVEGVYDRKMARQHKKEQKDFQFQEDRVQGGMNETDQGSQKRRIFANDRHGKEKVKNRLKASKKSDRVSPAEQTDQHISTNRMSFFEKSGPDEAGSKFMHGQHVYGNTHDEKRSFVTEVQGSVIGQHVLQENVDLYGRAKHGESEPSNQEHFAEAKQQHSLKHGYNDEALSEDCIAHQMFQQGKFTHKKYDPVEREVHTRSNGKVRSARARHAFDNVHQGEELCHMDPYHAETKSKHRSRSNKKDRFTNEFDNEQLEKSPRRRNHHVERGTRVDVLHGIDKSLSPGEVDFGIDYWQSPIIGNGALPEKREPPHADPSYGETRCEHKRRSNGTPRRGRATNEQVRSPCKRNHVEAESRFEESGPGKNAYEIKNRQALPKGNGSLPDYGDGTFKVQKGRKQHTTKHHYEGPQQEAWADYNESMVPERATNMSPSSYICADDMRYDSKYRARHREKNLHQTEIQSTVATIETCWDHDEARQNGSILEPCMDGELLPGDRGHVRQKHKRSAKKHISDLENSIRRKPERIAEDAENFESHRLRYTNVPHLPENESSNVAHREREHLPQWHNQFDPMPRGCETRALPQGNTTNGLREEQKEPESLHEDLVAKRSSCNRVDGNSSSPNRFSKPPQRPPPPLPPYKVSSMPNRKPLNSPPAMPQRSVTLETSHVRTSQEPHVHPKLPEYEDLVASFAALRNKPARPSMYQT